MPYTQFIDQLVISSKNTKKSSGITKCNGHFINCILGRSGIRQITREGSGATPAGIWKMLFVLYREDRIAKPKTGLTCFKITRNDSWCDNPQSRHYNLPLGHIPKNTDEKLWRKDCLYDLIVVLSHNTQPAIPNLGSAIFLHTAKKGNMFTQGCVAYDKPDLLRILSLCNSKTNIIIKN